MSVEPIDPAVLARERYGDVEQMLVDWLEQALALLKVRARTQLPEGDSLLDLLDDPDVDALLHVEAYDGHDVNAAQEIVNVDVDTYVGSAPDGNADDDGCERMAALVHAAMLFHLPNHFAATADDATITVQRVATFSRPTARPYDDNSAIRKRGAAYQLTVATRG